MPDDLTPAMPAARRFCSWCGAGLGDGARFCEDCGQSADSDPELAPSVSFGCVTCGGEGQHLAAEQVFCPGCRWLRPLGEDFRPPLDAFLWSLDAQAMGALTAIGPLRAAAQALSDRVGRPWLEASVNGVRLGPTQVPEIFGEAVTAARIVGLARMPDVYVSGDVMWDASALGSNASAFIVISTSLAQLQGDELRFLLGREMGRVAAGHTLWRTVLQVMNGKTQVNRTILGQGVLAFLNPAKFVESAVHAPLMAWARQAEITADRAGLLVVGRYDVARKVILQWALKSLPMYERLNLDDLEQQLLDADGPAAQISEWTMSSMPSLGRRLRLCREYCHSEQLTAWRRVIDYWLPRGPAQND